MRTLQDILTDLSFFDLPPAWQDYDLATFSPTMRLWDYQQEALQFALRALWKYYGDVRDLKSGESRATNEERKARFWQWYHDNGLAEDLSISLQRQKPDVRALLKRYYPSEGDRIPYWPFINRMSFWMATGSGKSLVLIKLIELLWRLMRRNEIPAYPILVLTARDDLMKQLQDHVAEFNASRADFRIVLESLKAYPDREHSLLPIIGGREMTVFFYRADNLSDEQKERIIDYRNYENGGHWYVLLDEAHKGDREDSKRQHIYSILTRHGFLFNFSATFTDLRDVLTTVFNFNLAEFIRTGYGKHITILQQENRAFRDTEDYTGAEKQRVVLKALLMLAYARKAQESLPSELSAYHRPLMLTLAHSVNTDDADLKLFFRELERIGQGNIDQAVWQQAHEELRCELMEGQDWLFENDRFQFDQRLFESLTQAELLRLVYNATAPGKIDVLLHPTNSQEMAFKLKSASQPFALIKIGNISEWLKEELDGYEIIESYQDDKFFNRLNANDSVINILMGSRAFYEGWDSNRPNVITYINIGAGGDAKKFVLQSIGRGVRIEPLPGYRRRLRVLYNAKDIDENTFHAVRGPSAILETLCIFGTNRRALQTVMQELDHERNQIAEHEIALAVNHEAVDGRPLLIPVYREVDHTVLEGRKPRKFEITKDELTLLCQYVAHLDDPRVLICHYSVLPSDVTILTRCLANPPEYFNTHSGRRYGRLDILLPRLLAYFRVIPQEVDRLKPVEDEINHFRHIKVFLEDVSELNMKISRVIEEPRRIAELQARFDAGQISFAEALHDYSAIRSDETLSHNGQMIHIKQIARHYYLPLLVSESERIDWILHTIRHPSEVAFLRDLEEYLKKSDNAFADLDWWAFSKIDENLDGVYIPYYDPQSNRIRRFLPDFVFWLQKGDRYAIVFVDPKGMRQADYQYKVDGFRDLFRDGEREPDVFIYKDLVVCVHLLLYTEDANRAPIEYQEHWFDHLDKIGQIINCCDDPPNQT